METTSCSPTYRLPQCFTSYFHLTSDRQHTIMKSISRAGRLALGRIARPSLRAQLPVHGVIVKAAGSANNATRNFHSSVLLRGIMPESENPPPKQSEESESPTVPTDITTSEFHEHADQYLDELLNRLEEKQEESPDYDVEYSVIRWNLSMLIGD